MTLYLLCKRNESLLKEASDLAVCYIATMEIGTINLEDLLSANITIHSKPQQVSNPLVFTRLRVVPKDRYTSYKRLSVMCQILVLRDIRQNVALLIAAPT